MPRAAPDLPEYLAAARRVILPESQSAVVAPIPTPAGPLRVGVDLGTAYLVLVVLDEACRPLAGEYQFAEVVRDGLVVDFIGAVDRLRAMKARVERRLGRPLTQARTGFPPGVPQVEVRATANVVEAAEMDCTGLVDEPSAANRVLGLRDGAIVDVGGGTTGIAIVRGGQVVSSADEPTGGTHFSLVIAGALDIPFEDAEALKTTPGEQARLFPLVEPVMEKVGTIVNRYLRGQQVDQITLVGGASLYPGMAAVIQRVTGRPARVAPEPLLITPLGIAMVPDEDGTPQAGGG